MDGPLLVFMYLDSGQEGGQLRGRDHQLCDVLARLLLHPIVPVNIIIGNKYDITNLHALCFKVGLSLETKDHIAFFGQCFMRYF